MKSLENFMRLEDESKVGASGILRMGSGCDVWVSVCAEGPVAGRASTPGMNYLPAGSAH